MRAPAGVSGTRPRRPAQAPTLPSHLVGFRKFPAASHRCRLWPAPPQPSCETGVRMVSFLPASCVHCLCANLPCGVDDNHGHSRKVPVVATCGSPALGPQPSGVLFTSAPVIGSAPRAHAVNSCQPARRAPSVPTQPACRLPAGIFPLPVAAARLWPAPPPRLTAAAATSGRFRLWSPRLPVSGGLQLRRQTDVMGPSQWLPQSRLTTNRRARAAQ